MRARASYASTIEYNIPIHQYHRKAYRIQPVFEHLRLSDALKDLQIGKYKFSCSSA